jgi:hypothetical protein
VIDDLEALVGLGCSRRTERVRCCRDDSTAASGFWILRMYSLSLVARLGSIQMSSARPDPLRCALPSSSERAHWSENNHYLQTQG